MKTTNLIPTLTNTPWLFVTLQSLVSNATRSSHDKWWTGISTIYLRLGLICTLMTQRQRSWQHLVNHPDIIRLVVIMILRIVIVIRELRPFRALEGLEVFKGALTFFYSILSSFIYVLDIIKCQIFSWDCWCSGRSILAFWPFYVGLILR